MSIINLEGVEKVYRTSEIETIALENVNLRIEKGEFVSIMGPSGCGKSTLLNIIGLLDKATKGKVEIIGTDTESLGDTGLSHFRNANIGFVFQSFHLIPSDTGAKARKEKIDNVLERLGISHRKRHFPSQLSGGQCQRVAIARAIVGDPEIILADEPTGNLDSRMGAEVMELLHQLNKEDGRTIVMVTHNEEQARMTDRIIHFLDGRRIE